MGISHDPILLIKALDILVKHLPFLSTQGGKQQILRGEEGRNNAKETPRGCLKRTIKILTKQILSEHKMILKAILIIKVSQFHGKFHFSINGFKKHP